MAKKALRSGSYEDKYKIYRRNIAWVTTGFVLLMLAIHPFIMGPQKLANITEVRLASYLWFVVLYLLAMGIGAYLVIMHNFWPRGGIKAFAKSLVPHEYALLGYISVCFLTALTAVYPQYAWGGATARSEGFLILLSYVLVFFFVSRLYVPKLRDMIIFLVAAVLITVYAIFQYYGVDVFDLAYGIKHHELNHFSTMSNKNMYSTYLCIVFCISTVMFCQHKTRLRWAFLPMALLFFYMLLVGDTESGYVGLAGSFLLLFSLIAKDRASAGRFFLLAAGCAVLGWLFINVENLVIYQSITAIGQSANILLAVAAVFALLWAALTFIPWPKKGLKPVVWHSIWGGVVLLIVIAVLIAIPILAEQTGHRLLIEAKDVLQGNFYDSMGSNRGYIWRNALALVKQHPIIGFGTDNFAVAFYENFGEEATAKYGVTFDKVHNEYLQTLVDVGIVGLGALLAFYGLLLWRARKYLDNPMVMAVFLAMVCFLIQAFFNFAQPMTTPMVWVLWGILGAMASGRFTEKTRLERVK